ncbi:MAG: magnesium and cobalt transport protein CorA [Chloroflexi bacterium HGW-Chloroflexi-8]|nr:MAG: magnesium and cobalt transport protein CorA [Chloroflexi bacterium HGW-Chloroflexi-8]
MIRSLFTNGSGKIEYDLSIDRIKTVVKNKTGLLWVDFIEEDPKVCETIMKDIFEFHPLAIEDALDQNHVPRVDDWGTYLYLVLHAPKFNQNKDEPIETDEVDIFLGKHYLVTYQEKMIPVVEKVWDILKRDERYLLKGTDHLFYKIADDVIAEYMPLAEELDTIIDNIEDRIFDRPSQELLERIFLLKRSLAHLRRMIAPQREVFNKLARGDDQIIDRADRVFFRDIYDHLVRLYDVTESLRDLMGSVLDTYLSAVNNRMNEVMKTLTIITTLFMPLSFMAGFFGMNFFIPEPPITSWVSRPMFLIVVLLTISVPVGMTLWMRRRKWM